MTNDRATAGGDAAGDEPGLTQKNSATVLGEETLANDDADTGDSAGADDGTDTDTATDTEAVLDGTTSTHTRSGAIPSSYGAAGGTTDAYEEGAGESDARGAESHGRRGQS